MYMKGNRPCTTYLLQIYKELLCKASPLKLFNKILEKYLNVNFLVKLIILNNFL